MKISVKITWWIREFGHHLASCRDEFREIHGIQERSIQGSAPPLISWCIIPINYSYRCYSMLYRYHKPKTLLKWCSLRVSCCKRGPFAVYESIWFSYIPHSPSPNGMDFPALLDCQRGLDHPSQLDLLDRSVQPSPVQNQILGLQLDRNPQLAQEKTVLYLKCQNTKGWWLGHPSEKYESQLGWWHSQYMGK